MNEEEKKAQDERIRARSFQTMKQAIWSHLNSLLSDDESIADADLDKMTDEFIKNGMRVVRGAK